jgi:carboxylate-amine ligase
LLTFIFNPTTEVSYQQPRLNKVTESKSNSLHLFDAFGVELEYMIVNDTSLNVLPVTDQLIRAECGSIQSEIERGAISWSNELALHVVEFKTTKPVQSLNGLAGQFQQNVTAANIHLAKLGGLLLPSAMHPWMDPFQELQLWPHDCNEIYEAFHQIFDCRGHGWANLQSVHLNLPFCGDNEFGRLHAAIRLILPLLPGLAAASPVMDGRLSAQLDSRLEVYRNNSRRVPEVAGIVIPEQAYTQEEYDQMIFQPMFAAIAPLDPGGLLQDEFLNARGAIARFGRGSIEIRVIDIQECPAADLAVLQAAVAVLQALVSEKWSTTTAQRNVSVERLHSLLLTTIQNGEQAVVSDVEYLRLFGMTTGACTVKNLWRHLVDSAPPETDADTALALDVILQHGPLGRRIVNRLGCVAERDFSETLRTVYRELTECLANGDSFSGTPAE